MFIPTAVDMSNFEIAEEYVKIYTKKLFNNYVHM